MTPIDKLNFVNFFSVCDVAMDILEELQMTSENRVKIPTVRRIIRFKALYSADVMDIGLINKYGDYRLRALQYLKDNYHITDFKVLDSLRHRWDQEIEILVNGNTFRDFCTRLDEVYKKREPSNPYR